MVYAIPAPGQQTQQSQNKGGGGNKKPDWDPRAGQKDFAMMGQNALNAAIEVTKLEVAARQAAGGVFSEAEVLARVAALTEQFYTTTKGRMDDMQRPVPASLAQQAPASQAPPAAQASASQAPAAAPAAPQPQYQVGAEAPPAPAYPQPAAVPAPAYQAPAASAAPVGQTPYDGLPFFDHLVPFGKHATVNGVKGQPHITIAELAAGIDPGWLHWAAEKAPQGKYTDALTRAGNMGQAPSFQERTIHFLNAAEQRGTPVPKPEFRPNQ